MNEPLRASVVVPVCNRPDLLAQCLTALTEQDLEPEAYEVVICDDGSTDDVTSVVQRFAGAGPSVRLKHQPPTGPAAARNLGIRNTTAPIVVFVDSDVIVDRSLLSTLVNALDQHPDWQGAEASLHPMGGEEGLLWDAPASLDGGHYHTAGIAYRRTVLRAVGGFDEVFRLPACEDVELAVRVLRHGPIGFVPKAIAWHPRRRVNWVTHWRWRRHWRYELILAVRYGILAFPGHAAGPFPRLRVAFAALVTLPAGRLLRALRHLPQSPYDAVLACGYALFDGVCGLSVLPSLLWGSVPARQDYLEKSSGVYSELQLNKPARLAK